MSNYQSDEANALLKDRQIFPQTVRGKFQDAFESAKARGDEKGMAEVQEVALQYAGTLANLDDVKMIHTAVGIGTVNEPVGAAVDDTEMPMLSRPSDPEIARLDGALKSLDGQWQSGRIKDRGHYFREGRRLNAELQTRREELQEKLDIYDRGPDRNNPNGVNEWLNALGHGHVGRDADGESQLPAGVTREADGRLVVPVNLHPDAQAHAVVDPAFEGRMRAASSREELRTLLMSDEAAKQGLIHPHSDLGQEILQ